MAMTSMTYGTAQMQLDTRRSAGEKVWVNLQTGTGKGPGACNVPHQSGVNLWGPFRYKLLKYISFIHSSLVSSESLRLIIDYNAACA